MNNKLFDQATVYYKNRDYRDALRTYTQCLQDTSIPFSLGEVGLIYHRIGNCLVKLKNYKEAISAYTQAANDNAYDAKGALENNIGMAYASMHDYFQAAEHFQKAIDDPGYDSPYKAYMGLGNAQLKLGKSAEAGIAFREAALDEGNPDPAKALLNLGICFMALDRPADAIRSYESALDFEMSNDTHNRICASMGQAYAANGQMREAVEAFQEALEDSTYSLSDSASVDYQRATAEISKMSAAETGPVADMSGLDVSATGTFPASPNNAYYYDEAQEQTEDYPGYANAYSNTNTSFFETTDADLERLSKNMAKKDRKHRNVGLKVLIVIIIILILLFGAGVFGYTQGFGWPTQEQVIKKYFADPQGTSSEVFANTISADNKKAMTAAVTPDSNAKVDGMNKTATETVAYVTTDTGKGGNVTYKVYMVRDVIGWKISGVELYFPSQNQ